MLIIILFFQKILHFYIDNKGRIEEFDLVRTIYSSCAYLIFVLGIILNSFLLWLILKKTPAPMLIYSKLLMAPCIMDIFIAIMTFLVQPIPIVDHGYHAVIQNGFFRTTSSVYNYTANVLWFQMLLLFLCCTTIQFIFRYYIIIDGQIPKKLKYTTAIGLILLLIAHILLHFWSDFPYAEYTPQMMELAEQVYMEIGITHIRFSSFTPARSYQWILHCTAMISIFLICYCIIIYCFRGTRHYLLKSFMDVTMEGGMLPANLRKNLRMHEYNNQVTTALIVQAILPTVEVIELSLQTTLPIFFPNAAVVQFMVYAAIPLYFIPVLNPLGAVLLVKPYRKALMKMLGMNGKKRIKPLNSNGLIQPVFHSSTPIELPPAVTVS